jgi:hypothetical protein
MVATVLGEDMLSTTGAAQFFLREPCFLANAEDVTFQGLHVDHQNLPAACGCQRTSLGHSSNCRVLAARNCTAAKATTGWFGQCCGFQMLSPFLTGHGTLLLVTSDSRLVQRVREAGSDVSQLARIQPVGRMVGIIPAGCTAFFGSEVLHGGPSHKAVKDMRRTNPTAASLPLCAGSETGLRQFVYVDGRDCKTRETGRAGMYMKSSMDTVTYNRVLGAIDPKNCCTIKHKRKEHGCTICH